MKMLKSWSEVLYKKTSKTVLVCCLIIIVYIAIAIHFGVDVKLFAQIMLWLLISSVVVTLYIFYKEYKQHDNKYRELNKGT